MASTTMRQPQAGSASFITQPSEQAETRKYHDMQQQTAHQCTACPGGAASAAR